MKSIIIAFIALLTTASFVSAKSYEDFKQDYISVIEHGLSEEKLNNIFGNYTTIVFPEFSSSKLMNELKGQKVVKFPLEKLVTEPFYESSIKKFLHSENPNERILSYITLGSANDNRFNDILRSRLKSEKNAGSKLWACVALLYMGDNHTTELFDFLVENENFGDAHLIPLFFNLDKYSLRKTAYSRIKSDKKEAKILAVQTLSITGLTPETESLVKEAVETWEIEIKGYAICTMRALKMGHLKDTLAPLLEHQETRVISLEALANSPTPEDREFLFSLNSNKDKIPEDILDAYFKSQNPEMVERWLLLVRDHMIPDDYVFFVFKQPLLSSDTLLDHVLETIRKTKNVIVLQELPRALTGRQDKESIDLLISLLSHPDSTVRYWVASSLKNNSSPQLVASLPALIKNPELRTVALTDLLLSNKIDNLQGVFEEFWEPNRETSQDWRRSSIQYLSTYPKPKHAELFKTIIQDKNEDTFVKRSACIGLGKLQDASAIDLIINAMQEEAHSDYNVMTYLVVLGEIKGEKARQVIESYKDSSEEQVRNLSHKLLNKW